VKVFVNFAAFQLGWFSCVLGAAAGRPWAGPLVVLAVMALHFILAHRPWKEMRLAMLAMVCGLGADSLLLATGWIAYPNGSWLPGFAPYWIVAMWALFATTLNVSMRWTRNSLPLTVFCGALGGPLSYLAGERLGAISLLNPLWALAALALIWGVAMPVLTLLASRYDGVARPHNPGFILDDWKVSHHA
jgi:hypothetical protein